MLYTVDDVLREISAAVAAHPPERSGALLGVPGRPFVTRFVFDAHAETTGVTYKSSRVLTQRVRDVEQTEGLEFKGILHSHPSSLDRPSSQDAKEYEVGLALNPHMPFYLAPIVTHGPTRGLQPHELPLAGAKVSFYAAYRQPGTRKPAPGVAAAVSRQARDGVHVHPVAVQVVPVARDLQRVCAHFGGERIQEVGITDFHGRDLLTRRIVLPDGLELLFFFSEEYPQRPPLLLVTAAGASPEQMNLLWPTPSPGQDYLTAVLSRVLTPGRRHGKVYSLVHHGQGHPADASIGRRTSLVRTFGWGTRRAKR